ncbi:hypothetical protein Angca_001442, partial [Angiostrongylus cantonensis]
LSSSAVPYIAPQQQAYTQPVAVGGNHPYSLKANNFQAPYAVATPPQVQPLTSVPQIGTVTGQQGPFINNQPSTMYAAVPATVQQQGVISVPQQQPAPVGVQYASTVQQQQSTLGVQSSAPMTTQQYLQTVGLQTQQQPTAQFAVGQTQQSTLSAPYAGVNTSTPWIQQQQQQQPMQQPVLGQFQRQPPYQQSQQHQQQPVAAQQQPYQSGGLVKLNIM